MMLIAMLPTTAFAGYGDRWPGGGGSSKFNHLDIKLDGSLAYLNQNDEQKTVKNHLEQAEYDEIHEDLHWGGVYHQSCAFKYS